MKSYMVIECDELPRPSPHGEGGLKSLIMGSMSCGLSPSPHGEGGLKSQRLRAVKDEKVPPRTGRVD